MVIKVDIKTRLSQTRLLKLSSLSSISEVIAFHVRRYRYVTAKRKKGINKLQHLLSASVQSITDWQPQCIGTSQSWTECKTAHLASYTVSPVIIRQLCNYPAIYLYDVEAIDYNVIEYQSVFIYINVC